ncbi:MAG: hypothetical protein H6626_09315 [Pseudobdellovibrionaceae bacterium]|nr:hypothetical protein [Bdellovibrionales bacterium]USN46414.1 MAG: hypothetical protein H6626_09315 [Pseudobdellovibrionaceae bacterium]
MPRQLNRELFINEKLDGNQDFSVDQMVTNAELKTQNMITTKLAMELNQLKAGQRDLERKVELVNSRLNSLADATKKTIGQVQSAHKNFERVAQAAVQDLKSRISTLGGKMTESRIQENKTQELVDRHHQIVQAFELRLQQMQKLVSQQEMKLLNYQAAIDELRKIK